jgi:hypothetical protein
MNATSRGCDFEKDWELECDSPGWSFHWRCTLTTLLILVLVYPGEVWEMLVDGGQQWLQRARNKTGWEARMGKTWIRVDADIAS